MKLLMIGDVHHKRWEEFAAFDRVDRTLSALRACIDVAEEAEVGTAVFLGDLMEARNTVDPTLLDQFAEVVEEFLAANIQVVVVAGNHDMRPVGGALRDGDGGIISLLGRVGAEVVFACPLAMRERGVSMYVMPWNSSPKDLDDVPDSVDLIVGHLDVQGGLHEGAEVQGRFDTGMFKKPTFLGHYHEAQDMGQVHYPGCLLPQHFGDGENYGPIIVEVKDREVRHTLALDFPCPGQFVTVRAPIKGEPKTTTGLPISPLNLRAPCFLRLIVETDGSVDLAEKVEEVTSVLDVVSNDAGELAVRIETEWVQAERSRLDVDEQAADQEWIEGYTQELAPEDQASMYASVGNSLLEK